ncbi:MAG: NADH-quinone oxidoreductase subunit H, partial [Chloroflexi bacterium]|nr:NADH-quinone oxidoreductase subunit H [Chloroflexota bacterium]
LTTLWLRNTVPRLRIDQIMAFNWKFLVPLSIANIVLISLALKLLQELNLAPRQLIGASIIDMLPATIVLLLINGALTMYLLGILRRRGQEARREAQAAPAQFARATAATAD